MRSIPLNDVDSHTKANNVAETGSILAIILALTGPISTTPCKYNVKATAVPMTIIPIVASTPAKSNVGARVYVLPAHNNTIPPKNIPIPVTGTLP